MKNWQVKKVKCVIKRVNGEGRREREIALADRIAIGYNENGS